MKTFVSVVCVLLGAQAFAQEIGTEIPADQPPPPPPPAPSYEQPTPPPPPTQPGAAPAQAEGAPAMTGPVAVPGPRAGAFGIRAGFMGSSIPAPSTSSSAPGPSTPTVGFKYMATDSVGLNFDVGLGIGFGDRTPFGFGVGVGIDAYMGSAERPIRGFITGGVDFGKQFSPQSDDFVLGIKAGGGAEYWLNDAFSLRAELLLGTPISLEDSGLITISTFQPGVGATFYF